MTTAKCVVKAGDTDEVAALTARAVFYARCGALEDLAYAVETGLEAYLTKTLAALPWLYPAR
ncbi:hypothetical protein Sme01_51780 [Sphaerisporangium melleum]|uniref:Uncharacterized protein n=1 Tax=Sphaerisporangium melleum TaxID=321316 RepID=A0A917VGP6_9ACTN|nr:hypothetical protein [Sphaerisporangium melleum]GGK76036.1 hypothetical protein GCM10007964_18540 [Sphaerisporangium melleum]GII72702.1 hypothetical protein Sme01_51780 [Sphaerisporangium melleum]